MRSVVSLRRFVSVAALGVVVAGGVVWTGGRSSAARVGPSATPSVSVSVRDAVRRTVAAGSARLTARFVPATGAPVDVEGVTSFRGPESEVSASIGGGAGVAPVQVRATADGVWMRPPGAPGWTAIDPAAVALAAEAGGWADLLRRLEPAGGEAPGGGLGATLDGTPVRLWLDDRGRINRLRRVQAERGDTLDLRFFDFGVEVHVVAP